MNANELFERSKKAYEGKNSGKVMKLVQGLSNRTVYLLKRGGYDGGYGNLDVNKIKQDILNGDIWEVRQVGIKTVKELCEWICIMEKEQ